MKITIYLKHLVIPIIVVSIVFATFFLSTTANQDDKELKVSFLYSTNDISKTSSEKLIWDSLLKVQEESVSPDNDSKYITVDYSRSDSEGDAKKKLELYAGNSDVLYVSGEVYDSSLQDIIKKNSNKQFFVIDSKITYRGNNVSNINIDLKEIVNDQVNDAKLNSTTKKILYISEVKKEENSDYDFVNFDKNYDLAYLYVSNTSDYSYISSELKKNITEGYDEIIIDSINITDYIVSEAVGYQKNIVSESILKDSLNTSIKELETANENTNATSTEIDENNTKIDSLKSELEKLVFKQDYIDVYIKGENDFAKGIYIDKDSKENTVIKTIFVNNTYDLVNKQLTEILNDTYSNKEIINFGKENYNKIKKEDYEKENN